MKKLTSAFLVAILFLAPVLATAQTSGGAGGTQVPGSSPSDRPGSSPSDRPTDSPGIGQPTPPGSGTPGDPAASPPSTFDLSRHNTRAACEKAGGRWGEVSQSCTQK
jgi:hypothetical protein